MERMGPGHRCGVASGWGDLGGGREGADEGDWAAAETRFPAPGHRRLLCLCGAQRGLG